MTSWTNPRTWTIGEKVTKVIMDTHVRDNLNYLKEQIDSILASITTVQSDITALETKVYSLAQFGRSTNLSLADNTAVAIPWNNIYAETSAIDLNVDTTRIDLTLGSSSFNINGWVQFASNPTGYRAVQVQFYNSSSTLLATQSAAVLQAVTTDVTVVPFAFPVHNSFFPTLSYIKIVVRQTSGSTINLTAGAIGITLV